MLSTTKIMLDVQGTTTGRVKKRLNIDAARQIGDALHIYWGKFDVDQFMLDLHVKIENGRRDLATDGTVMN